MYQCPNCAANIKFDITRQTMHCDNCDTVVDPQDFEKNKDAEEQEYMDVNLQICPQCGGQIICDDNEAAAFCSFCGASTILDSRISQAKRPRYIIPFKRTKQDCVNNYHKKMKRNPFALPELKSKDCINSFRGIYMPYWSYSMERHGNVTIASRGHGRRSGDYIYEDIFNQNSHIDINYSAISHDASSSFSDNLSEAIAPYDESEKQTFTPAYLSGFYADTYDVEESVYRDDMRKKVVEDCAKKYRKLPKATIHKIKPGAVEAALAPQKIRTNLLMVPVWFMSARIKEKGQDRVSYFVVNGQSGKVAGDTPISVQRYLVTSVILSALIFLVMHFFMNLIYKPEEIMWASLALNSIMAIIFHSREKKIDAREIGRDDKGLMSKLGLKKKAAVVNKKWKEKRHTFIVFCWIATFLVYEMDLIYDSYLYIAAIVNMIFMLRSIIMTIFRFNMLCSRKLPQFNRTGGDDRAV